jgi:hypothetical protein
MNALLVVEIPVKDHFVLQAKVSNKVLVLVTNVTNKVNFYSAPDLGISVKDILERTQNGVWISPTVECSGMSDPHTKRLGSSFPYT